MSVEVRQAGPTDASAWAALRQALWPEENPERHLPDIAAMLARPGNAVAFLALEQQRVVGFAEATLRRDYVNGTNSSPVGFLEGWYVEEAFRRKGIGRALIAAIERWTVMQGCSELASDAMSDNLDGHVAHAACGFEETDRVVYFRKRLD